VNESIYARPEPPRILLRPVLATIVLHVLLILAMTVNWQSAERTVKVKPMPKVINAKLVDLRQLQPEPAKKPAAKPVKKAAPKSTARPKPKPAAVKKPVRSEPKPAPTPKKAPAKPKVEPKPEPGLSEAELAAMAMNDISRALAEEEQQHAAATSGELTASYAALIQQTVMNYWSRPASARNGMQALLAIQLIPSGDVINVTVLESSGSTAFDRSAVNAVKKAASFPELQQLPKREFEKSFRRFRLLFRPEDLRY
jgi:TonB family protein